MYLLFISASYQGNIGNKKDNKTQTIIIDQWY